MNRREFLKVGLLTIAGVSGAIKLPDPIESADKQPSIISDEFQQCLDGTYQTMLDRGLPDDIPVVLIVAPELKKTCWPDVDTIEVLGQALAIGVDKSIFVGPSYGTEIWLQPEWGDNG